MNELRLTDRYINLLRNIANSSPDSYLDIKSNNNAIYYIRKVLGKKNILTARGVGYRVTDDGRNKAKEILKRVDQYE